MNTWITISPITSVRTMPSACVVPTHLAALRGKRAVDLQATGVATPAFGTGIRHWSPPLT